MKSNVIKRCNTCGRFLSEDDFHWLNKKRGYKESQCKKCSNNMSSMWCNNNKEHKKLYDKQNYQDNKEKIDKRNKQWYKNNEEKIIQYRINNKEKYKEYYIKWCKNNLEKVAAFNANYRSLKESQTPVLNEEEQKRINRLYEICKQLNYNSKDFHVDHIQPISKGGLHHPDNLQILPDWLNCEKNNKWPLTEQEEIKYEGIKI